MKGRISDSSVEELKQRADIVEVVSGYVQLKKAGRAFKGLCCFHQEKTPSLTVNPEKGFYYCHGCGAGGDVFTFIRKIEGLEFNEAAERLADRFGVQLRYEGGSGPGRGHRLRLYDANREAAAYFSDQLLNSGEATLARKHWEGRGFSREDAVEWGVGYAPPASDRLFRDLLGKKFTEKEIVDAGLAMVTEGGEHRDRFRGRLIFPISDVSGQIVGFGARALGEEPPKYLNSPETPLYHKGRVLYGLDRAKSEMSQGDFAVATEGYTDVIALHRVGVKSAVATCGTALGEEHFAAIKKFCDRVILAFDADPAGSLASERGFQFYSKVGLEVLVAPLPEGQDPADVALNEGEEVVRKLLDEAQPLMRFVLEAELNRQRLDTPEGKARAVRAAAAILSREPSRVARGEHAFWLARRIGVNPDQVQIEIAEAQEGGGDRSSPQAMRLPGHVKVEREALAICLESHEGLEAARELLTEEHFTLPEHRIVWKSLLEGGDQSLMERLPDDDSRRLAAQLAVAEMTTQDPEEVFRRLEEFRVTRTIEALRATLDTLDQERDADRHDAVFKELMVLEAERRSLTQES